MRELWKIARFGLWIVDLGLPIFWLVGYQQLRSRGWSISRTWLVVTTLCVLYSGWIASLSRWNFSAFVLWTPLVALYTIVGDLRDWSFVQWVRAARSETRLAMSASAWALYAALPALLLYRRERRARRLTVPPA